MELADLKVTRYAVEARVATITLHRPERLNAWTGRMHTEYRWLLQRALSGGQEFARKTVAGRYGAISFAGRAKLIARSLAQLVTAGILALVTWPFGKHRSVAWLVRASANLGKVSIFLGWRYQEYA